MFIDMFVWVFVLVPCLVQGRCSRLNNFKAEESLLVVARLQETLNEPVGQSTRGKSNTCRNCLKLPALVAAGDT